MVSHAIAKFLPSLRLRLGTKAVISAVLLIAVNTALVIGAAYWSLTASVDERDWRGAGQRIARPGYGATR